MTYTKERPLRVFTSFSGYDSQCLALERLKRDFPSFDYQLVGWAEFDPESKTSIDRQPAVVAHNALFPESNGKNYGDITKIDWDKVPDFDLFTMSSPCQDFSQAGLQRGGTEGSGTRSSLLWECRKAILAKKPKFILLENVAALVSSKFLPYFNIWRDELHSYGYNNFAEVLNAKNFGVPQNRERIFLLSIRDDGENPQYYFPNKMELKNKLKDVLEDNTDVKYYLNPNKVDQFVKENMSTILDYARSGDGEIEPLPDHLKKWLDEYPEEDGSGQELTDPEQEVGKDIFEESD